MVVKRYRKRTRNASEQHHDGNGCPSVTQPAPLLQSTHKAKANPPGLQAPVFAIKPYPLPDPLFTQMLNTEHWSRRAQPSTSTYKQSPVQYTSRCLACTTMGRAPAFAKEARPPPLPKPGPQSLRFRPPTPNKPLQWRDTATDTTRKHTGTAKASPAAVARQITALPISPAPVRPQEPSNTRARNDAARKLAEEKHSQL